MSSSQDRTKTDEAVATLRQSRFKTARRNIRRFIKRFGSWVGVTYLALASFLSYLVHFHAWPEHWEIVPVHELPAFAFVVGLLFILSEQVKEYTEDTASTANTLDRRVTSLGQDISNLASQVSPQLKLNQCVEKLRSYLSDAPYGSVVTIHHIALDMQVAWLHVREKIFDVERILQHNHIKYHLLIMSEDAAKPINEPVELQNQLEQMRARAKYSLEVISNYFNSGKTAPRLVEIEIRTYTSLPNVHGIFVDKPTPVHFVTFSGWRGAGTSNYHWGEGHYYEIEGSPQMSSSMGDVTSLFDGSFDNLWDAGKKVYPRTAVEQGPAAVGAPGLAAQ